MEIVAELHRIPQHIARIPQHIAAAKQAVPSILSGVSYMTALISVAVASVVGGGLGWWLGKRGVTGVQADLNTVKADVASLKAKITPA